jgi:hypothetical protein
MPTLISETEVRLERSDLERRVVLSRKLDADGYIVPPRRSPGLHLSGLLKYVATKTRITAYIQDAQEEDAIERGHLPLRWFLGQVWEEAAASLYPEMIWQPGELNNPLVMNCDGFSYNGGEGNGESVVDGESVVIEEFKLKRAKRADAAKFLKNWIFMQQGLGYCCGYSAQFVRWHVCYLFEFPDPIYVKYLVRFSRDELAAAVRMIEVNRLKAIEEGYAE